MFSSIHDLFCYYLLLNIIVFILIIIQLILNKDKGSITLNKIENNLFMTVLFSIAIIGLMSIFLSILGVSKVYAKLTKPASSE